MNRRDNDHLKNLSDICVSRRDFIRYSSLALTAASMPSLIGCAKYRPRQDCQTQLINGATRYHDNVFESTNIGNIRLNNRIIRSATTLGLGDEQGRPLPQLADAYIELAKGGVGAIITDMVAVQKNGVGAMPNTLLIHTDDQINSFRRLSDAAHRFSTPVIMQIAHSGRQTRRVRTGEAPVAPSPVKDNYYNEETPRELSESEIQTIIENFINAIERAKKADFDGVQLHAAHGYLLSEFLSADTNRRTDQWGGSIENRFRIIRDILAGARKRVGDYPILIKVNAYDFQPNGMRVEEMVKIAGMLESAGCSAIEVSCGIASDGFSTIRVREIPTDAVLAFSFRYKDSPYMVKKILPVVAPLMVDMPEPLYNYNVCAAQEIKQKVGIPVIAVGGIRNIHDIEQIIGRNMADYVAMARPFIIEPDIANRFKKQSQASSNCISCGYCLLALEEMPTQCFYGQLP